MGSPSAPVRYPPHRGPHDRKNTAVMGISISHMRNQSPGNHPGEQISSLHCVSINNTTIYSNEPVRVRPNPRPQKGVVPFRLVWFRKSKRNNKPNHKQFIIHESINTHSTEQDELPAAKQRKVADTNGRLLHDTAQMAHLSCVGQKAMDDVIRQNVEQETENSVNDVSAFISKNKMNDDF